MLRDGVDAAAVRVIECSRKLGHPDTPARFKTEEALRDARAELARWRAELAAAERRLTSGELDEYLELAALQQAPGPTPVAEAEAAVDVPDSTEAGASVEAPAPADEAASGIDAPPPFETGA